MLKTLYKETDKLQKTVLATVAVLRFAQSTAIFFQSCRSLKIFQQSSEQRKMIEAVRNITLLTTRRNEKSPLFAKLPFKDYV